VQEFERFAALAGERYVSLTTFKRDGSMASTPVWVVSDDGKRLLVWTGVDTWKVKRIRRDPRMRVTPSDGRGRVRGEPLDGTARLLGPDAAAIVEPLLRKNYGFIKRALDGLNGVMRAVGRRSTRASEYIEILPAAH
jgi:PPOX class probable F420-dependent enzyme